MKENAALKPLDGNDVRRRLIDDCFLAQSGTTLPDGIRLRSQDELARSLDQALADRARDADVHVFGIGSLMWNPAIDAADARVASVHGWHRSFCLRSQFGRGSADKPGVMLALDRGGSCRGMLFRIEATKARFELQLLWRREMALDSYEARWIRATAGEHSVMALAFVADRRCRRYVGRLPIAELTQLVRTGEGSRGSTRTYFEETCAALERLGIRDANIERLRDAVRRADRDEL